MLDLEVVPERSLGNEQWEFCLGMPISQAIAILRRHCRVVKDIHMCYCDSDPLAMDVIMNLTQDGVRLVFDPNSQRLKIIEVYDLEKVRLKYCGVPFNTPSISPTNDQIEMSFGATHPGIFDPANQQFILNFRGLSFFFPSNDKLEHNYSHGLGSLQFSNGPPVVSKLCIYMGNSLTETKAPPLPISCYLAKCYSDTVQLVQGEAGTVNGLKVTLYGESGSPSKHSEVRKSVIVEKVLFGDSCQDVMSALGAPCKVYYKDEDKMKIHSTSPDKQVINPESDYFYNYFTLGLDILFDGSKHRAKKFILHSNYPGHYDFNIYHRCYFELQLKHGESEMLVTTCTKWDTVQEVFSTTFRKPVVLNRRSSTNTTNPFGPTFCYGLNNLIFEVMPSNNYIASVTIFPK